MVPKCPTLFQLSTRRRRTHANVARTRAGRYGGAWQAPRLNYVLARLRESSVRPVAIALHPHFPLLPPPFLPSFVAPILVSEIPDTCRLCDCYPDRPQTRLLDDYDSSIFPCLPPHKPRVLYRPAPDSRPTFTHSRPSFYQATVRRNLTERSPTRARYR